MNDTTDLRHAQDALGQAAADLTDIKTVTEQITTCDGVVKAQRLAHAACRLLDALHDDLTDAQDAL